jgi:glycosyltransferase involved in cell wall biosynthesis
MTYTSFCEKNVYIAYATNVIASTTDIILSMNSTVYSGIKMMAKWLHDVTGVTKKINAFVVPSEFTLGKLNEYGIPKEKLYHIPTFFNLKEENPQVEYQPFVLFVGRIEKQKGLMTLVKAFEGLPYKLKIIGFSNDGYEDELKAYNYWKAAKEHCKEYTQRFVYKKIGRHPRIGLDLKQLPNLNKENNE